MKHVLITGGAGFIGSHLTEQLLDKGYAVTAVDNFLTGRLKNVEPFLSKPTFQLLEHDVSKPIDEQKCLLIKKWGLHGIFHFACPASPVDFDKIPFEILSVDSLGTIHTVDMALRYNVRYLLASTSEIYGDPLVHPQKEDYFGNVSSIGPRACYDEAKRFAEAYVSTAIRGVGTYQGKPYRKLNGGMVRIFNTYGPRMRPDDGRIVPELCMQALKGLPLTIHGDGMQTRSFCFVSDLVAGVIKLFESDEKQPVNIGNPVERTVLEFAQTVRNLCGSKSAIQHLEARPHDPKRRCPDISKANEVLGWAPQVDLEQGLKQTLDYFRNSL